MVIRRKRLCDCILPVKAGRRGVVSEKPVIPPSYHHNNKLVFRSTDSPPIMYMLPGKQLQSKVVSPFWMQVPPFWHGDGLHGM